MLHTLDVGEAEAVLIQHALAAVGKQQDEGRGAAGDQRSNAPQQAEWADQDGSAGGASIPATSAGDSAAELTAPGSAELCRPDRSAGTFRRRLESR